jgi:hypothetical protein
MVTILATNQTIMLPLSRRPLSSHCENLLASFLKAEDGTEPKSKDAEETE